jgi:hypothetical protein
LRRRLGYVVTTKTGEGARHAPFIAWNAVLALALIAAGWIGRHAEPAAAVQWAAAAMLALALGLCVSGLRKPPPAYVPGLWQPTSSAAVTTPAADPA